MASTVSAGSVRFNTDVLDRLRVKVRKLATLSLTLGFQGKKAGQEYETGINVATVATFNEFGTQDIPARSYLRAAMFEFRSKIANIFAAAYQRMLATKSFTPEDMLAEVGRKVVALVERKIRDSRSWAKPNAPSTIRGKGFDFPLHEEFILSRSVTWAVRGSSGTILSIGGSSG